MAQKSKFTKLMRSIFVSDEPKKKKVIFKKEKIEPKKSVLKNVPVKKVVLKPIKKPLLKKSASERKSKLVVKPKTKTKLVPKQVKVSVKKPKPVLKTLTKPTPKPTSSSKSFLKSKPIKKPLLKLKSAEKTKKKIPLTKAVEEIIEVKPKPKPKLPDFSIDEVLKFLNYEVSPELKEVILILEEKEVISENEVAEKLNIKINGARKLLYVLREWGFAEYEKKSDENKNWWFIYFWSLNREKILNKYVFSIKSEIKKRKELITEESDYSFSCSNCNIKYTYSEALENNFECKECTGVLEDLNNQKVLNKIQLEIESLHKRLVRLNRE